MPKLYEYFGLIVMFYANEHEPVHVHGKFQGRESRAEIILVNGAITEIRYTASRNALVSDPVREGLELGPGNLVLPPIYTRSQVVGAICHKSQGLCWYP